MKSRMSLPIIVLLLVCVTQAHAQSEDRPWIPRSSDVRMGMYGNGKGGALHQPGSCNGEACVEPTPLALGNAPEDKSPEHAYSFDVNMSSPMTSVTEHASAKAVGKSAQDLTTSELAVTFANMNYIDVGFAAAAQNASQQGLNMAQARYLAELEYRAKLDGTKFGQLISQAYEGCLSKILKGGKSYAEAQEICQRGDVTQLAAGASFEALPGKAQTVDLTFNDLPGMSAIPHPSDTSGKSILLSELLFGKERLIQGDSVAGKIQGSWVKLLGDYRFSLTGKRGGGLSIDGSKIWPTATWKAPSGSLTGGTTELRGLNAIRAALYSQVLNSLYAFEYAHCLIAATDASNTAVFPDGSQLWTGVEKDQATKWPKEDAAEWYLYDTNDPLRLEKTTMLGHVQFLSAANFNFNMEFETALWFMVKKWVLNSANTKSFCDGELRSWKTNFKPWDQTDSSAAMKAKGAMDRYARAISRAQVYTFLASKFQELNAVSSGMMDDLLREKARDIIMQYVTEMDQQRTKDENEDPTYDIAAAVANIVQLSKEAVGKN